MIKFQVCTLKARLGGEARTSDINIHKGYCFVLIAEKNKIEQNI